MIVTESKLQHPHCYTYHEKKNTYYFGRILFWTEVPNSSKCFTPNQRTFYVYSAPPRGNISHRWISAIPRHPFSALLISFPHFLRFSSRPRFSQKITSEKEKKRNQYIYRKLHKYLLRRDGSRASSILRSTRLSDCVFFFVIIRVTKLVFVLARSTIRTSEVWVRPCRI